MIGFLVKAGTRAWVINDDQEWYSQNFSTILTDTDQVFFREELVVNPTGIGKSFACVPGGVTVGSHWAEMGYYGFRRGGRALLVGAAHVEVGWDESLHSGGRG